MLVSWGWARLKCRAFSSFKNVLIDSIISRGSKRLAPLVARWTEFKSGQDALRVMSPTAAATLC